MPAAKAPSDEPSTGTKNSSLRSPRSTAKSCWTFFGRVCCKAVNRFSVSAAFNDGQVYDQPPEGCWPAAKRRASVWISRRSLASLTRSSSRMARARSYVFVSAGDHLRTYASAARTTASLTGTPHSNSVSAGRADRPTPWTRWGAHVPWRCCCLRYATPLSMALSTLACSSGDS